MHDRLLGALGLMIDGPRSAELAYWVRPENRRRGLALRGVGALTRWAHDDLGLDRIWLEIEPGNTPRCVWPTAPDTGTNDVSRATAEPGRRPTPTAIPGTTA